jgi:hypothetical protein
VPQPIAPRGFQLVGSLAAVGFGYVVAGYTVTALALAGYVGSLLIRARRARIRAGAIAAKRAR